MKNRAKCKLCFQILESFHTYDYVTCNCGEISISGGNDRLECSAKNWENFLRVDENGNEIVVKVKDSVETTESNNEEFPIMTRADKIDMLEAMVKNIENLPKAAMAQPINNFDMYSYLVVILSILKDEKSPK
jgi:hypothetical protein